MVCESWGAIAFGWVRRNMVEPERSFTFLGFEWLQGLLGPGMYVYFVAMGFAALGVVLGYRYRLSALAMALLWSGAYFMQKTSYNNHYYLTMLLCWWMVLLPAHLRFSLDALRQNLPPVRTCARWIPVFAKAQLLIVFVYGSVAKFYPGWLEGDFIGVVFGAKTHYPVIGPLLGEGWFQTFITYGAIVFDALVIPLLWWGRTRALAFVGLILFNVFNSVVFGIGIFPYLVLANTIFFFDARHFERVLHRFEGGTSALPELSLKPAPGAINSLGLGVLAVYFAFQVLLPLRHHLVPGDVNWREEGHRMSWRMMLRSKSGYITLEARDPIGGTKLTVPLDSFLTDKQRRRLATKPFFAWRFAQDLEAHYRAQGWDEVEVYVRRSRVWLNGKGPHPIIGPDTDLTAVGWNYWGRNEWVLDRPGS